jgi:K(+)-stimulated pyrophosphate-energized sodium pump
MLPFLFSSLAMGAVGKAAMAMIEEVRRQFKEIPVLKDALAIMKKYDSDLSNATKEDMEIFEKADGAAEYEKCVAISTQASIRKMILPGLIAVLTPPLVGFFGGAEMLGGLLAGVTVTGVMMAIFQSNAGGAWDNAKKMIEEGTEEVNGEKLVKGSEAHKAAVVGDTVGDPFKDTSGPSLNILIKLMSVVSLILAPSLATMSANDDAAAALTTKENIEVTVNVDKVEENGETYTVTTTKTVETVDGEKKLKYWMINDMPGLYAKIIMEETDPFGELDYRIQELEKINYKSEK